MSLLGFHVASSKRNGAGLLLDAGAPLVVMVDQNMIAEVHDHGAFAAYRSQHSPLGEDNPQGLFDAPYDSMPAFAGRWMDSLHPIYNLNAGADCYIINNELDPPTPKEAEKLNAFYLRCMTIAESWGIKIGICSFSSGCPSDDDGYSLEDRWYPLLPAVEHAAMFGHFLVLHAHCLSSDSMMQSGEAESLRHQRTLRYFALHDLYPRIIIGELSNGVGGVEPDLPFYMTNVKWWDQTAMSSEWRRQIVGAALYGFNGDETIAPAVNPLCVWIADNPTPPDDEDPPPDQIDYPALVAEMQNQIDDLKEGNAIMTNIINGVRGLVCDADTN